MKIPEGMNPALVASTDRTRYIISHVQYQDGLLAVTDGRRLMVAISEESEEHQDARQDALIPVAVVAQAVKGRKGRFYKGDIQITETGFVIRPDLDSENHFKDKKPENFPEWRKALPPKPANPCRLSFNSTFLAGLTKAMGSDQVTLHFDPEDTSKAMFVTVGKREAFGILMPIRSDDKISENKAYAKATQP